MYLCEVKQLTTLLLIVLLFLQLGYRLSIISSFELNREIIKKSLCVNRDNTKSNCNGQCYLMKQIHESEERSSDLVLESLLKIEPLIKEDVNLLVEYSIFICFDQLFAPAVYRYHSSDYKVSILKPPRA